MTNKKKSKKFKFKDDKLKGGWYDHNWNDFGREFEKLDIISNVEYGKFRLGNKSYTLTRKQGDAILEWIDEANRTAKSAKQLREARRTLTNYIEKDAFQNTVFMESIYKQKGIMDEIQRAMRGSTRDMERIKKIAKIKRLLKNKTFDEQQYIYENYKDLFTDLTDYYARLKYQDYSLDEHEKDDLEFTLDWIIEILEDRVPEV